MRLRILLSAIATFSFGVLVVAGCTSGAPAGNNERGGGTDVEGPPPLAYEVTPPPTDEVTAPPTDEVTPPPADEVTPPLAYEVTPPPTDEVTPPPADEVTPPPADEVTVAKNHAIVIQTVADDTDERDIVALFVTRAPSHGQAEPWGDLAVRYAPTRHFTGVDEFHYQLVRREGEVETVVVNVQVVDEDWVVVAGGPLLLRKVDVPSSDGESGTTVTDGYERFDVPLALETHLVGASGVWRLTGSFIDTDGRRLGFVTEAVDLPEGQQVESLLNNPAHSSVGNHVCAHTTTGPFDDLEAADSDRAPLPSFAEVHTSYAVSLPTADGGYGGWLSHQTLLGGRLTFFLSHHVLFRLSDAEGATIAPALVDVSSSCAGIKRFFQYELPQESGEYTIQLSRASVPVVHLILEKVWVHEDVGH